MFGILDTLEEWIRNLLISIITSNLTNLFDDVNTKVGTIATEVGQTPQGWNSGIFNMVKSLSDNVIVPIAGLIITFVLCYELITAITEKNNMHDVDTFIFFKYVFKAFVAVYLLSHTFDITMAVFDVAQTVVNHAGGLITDNTSIDITTTIASMQTEMESMELGGLVQLTLETSIISLTLKIMSILITVILYGRMIEIYLTVSVAPIPFATMTNREWGTIGTNYFKSLLALGFQGFFMMVCVAIYAVLVNAMTISSDIHMALFSIAAYTVILCLSLLKTSSLARSIFGAH
ncbi:VirB6/TrbL-like conjugal transfer protein, CD1112 family [Mediterraneibacter faecis]|uniref:VirB6/TrbL-like conjugal transfer protein, CD1112 family n=1 Tax=Bariatricus sp. HCP28S3_D3 TaxID=3438901 RepID=UPI002A8C684B|nr:CD0415/CD1112 family protein [Blautia sp.]MDY5028038.1 CD0415/CD1112 family protein [Oliverpabstia sp.]